MCPQSLLLREKTSYEKFMASSAVNPVKTELALIDDLNTQYNLAIDMQEKAEIMIVDYNDMANKISSLLNQTGMAYLKANARFQEVENATKDLGIELPQNLKNRKQIISESIKEVDAYMKKLASNKVPL